MTEIVERFTLRPEPCRRGCFWSRPSEPERKRRSRPTQILTDFLLALMLAPVAMTVAGLLLSPLAYGHYLLGAALLGTTHYLIGFGPLACVAVFFRVDNLTALISLSWPANFIAYFVFSEFSDYFFAPDLEFKFYLGNIFAPIFAATFGILYRKFNTEKFYDND